MTKESAPKAETQDRSLWIFFIVLIAVAIVMVMGGVVIYQFIPIPHNSPQFTQADWLVFAALYSAVEGTFFSAVAFAGLIYIAWMQREELSLQRQELRETREELKRTADAQEKSEAALSAQVEIAQLSARLNAATTLLEHHQQLLVEMKKPGMYPSLKNLSQKGKVDELLSELESIRASLIRTVEISMHAAAPSAATANIEVIRPKEA